MKRIASLLLVALMLAAMLPVTAFAADFTFKSLKGNGTAESPYLIKTNTQLTNFAKEVNNGADGKGLYFKLMNTNPTAHLLPIGTKEHPFRGHFDGGGNVVYLRMNKPDKDYVGLFGCADGAEIKNVYWQGFVTGHSYVGGICGYAKNTTISNCGYKNYILYNDPGPVTGSGDNIGGICGYLEGGSITGCTSGADVSGGVKVGGICGEIKGAFAARCLVKNCRNNGTVAGTERVGGIIGYLNYCDVFSCSNEGQVIVDRNYGGLLGSANFCELINCVNVGTLVASEKYPNVAGLIAGIGANIDLQNSISVGGYLDYDGKPPISSYTNFANIFGMHVLAKAVIALEEDANVFYDNSIVDRIIIPSNFREDTIKGEHGRTTEQMKSAEMLNTLNAYVDAHPELGLLKWKTGKDGYPTLDFPETGSTPIGSILSFGYPWIVIAIPVLAVVGVAALVIVKKKKKPALASGTDNTDEE